MKSNLKSKTIIFAALEIIFVLLPIIMTNSSFITSNSNKSSGYRDDSNLNNKSLKLSAVSGKIHIDNRWINDWTFAKDAGIVTGNGTYSEPYIIEDLVIDAGGSGSGILIENSDVYFRIENCTVYNSKGISEAYGYLEAGINLLYVSNGSLINNNVSHNTNGISLSNCDNNSVSGNTANNNNYQGIYLTGSDHNIISGNTANNNLYEGLTSWTGYNNIISGNTASNNHRQGIYLGGGYTNVISGNTANNNEYGIYLLNSDWNKIGNNTVNNNNIGIYLNYSNTNVVSGNILIGNNECIVEEDSTGNEFSDNGACTYGQGPAIPGYNLFFLFSTLFAAVILLRKKLRNS